MTGAIEPKPQGRMIDLIIAGAERAFLEGGYELATMETIARHAGVARASVYNNFASKEALFLAVMRRGIGAFVTRALENDDRSLGPLVRLRRVATNFLRAATDPDAVEMYRTVLSHGGRFPELSETLHRQGLLRIEAKLGELARLAGRDRIADPARFAGQLVALLMGGYFERRLLGIGDHPADGDGLAAYVDGAILALLPTATLD